MVKNQTGFFCKYAELGEMSVEPGEKIKGGQVVGYVGVVLNFDKITSDSPRYIQNIKQKGHSSMLHFELYDSIPKKSPHYSGGNWFYFHKPKNLLDPTMYLQSIFLEGGKGSLK